MKRITAFIIILIIALSSLNAFALDAGTHSVEIKVKNNIHKVAVSSVTPYNSEDLKQCVVYFKLPVPDIAGNQRVVDYRLKFYTEDN